MALLLLRKPCRAHRRTSFGLIAASLLACGQSASAATLTVTNLNDSGPGSLRDRIAVANSGDLINFAVQGQIGLASTLEIAKSLTIEGPANRNISIRHNTFFVINAGTVTISNIQMQDSRGQITAQRRQRQRLDQRERHWPGESAVRDELAVT